MLSSKKCVPCEAGTPPMLSSAAHALMSELGGEWKLLDEKKLSRVFKFKDFKDAMKFVNQVAEIAESEGHHPDIIVNYNRVTLELMTHAAGGLTQNDFIVAAKINAL